jgi:DNA-binding IclR family transcriptional regulator
MVNPTSSGKSAGSSAPALERGLAILELLARHPEGLILSEVAESLELPLNSAFRFLGTLADLDYVVRDQDSRRYLLTRKMAELSYRRAADRTLLEHSLDLMRVLRDQVRETVVISIVEGGEGIILEQVPGLHPFHFVVEHGARQSIHASASTKAILAWRDQAQRDAQLAGCAFTAFTPATITAQAAFLAELDQVRENGWAADRAEALEGVHCVAAPVRDRDGRAVAAITVTGPSQRLSLNDLAATAVPVMECARRISARLGFGIIPFHPYAS